ncbi:MAG: 50S ribosomal protein L18e, partial [Nanoarchaeota archaeon]|nr:50S ribosomal protein L18e [Nanoarchaeota archaeon]
MRTGPSNQNLRKLIIDLKKLSIEQSADIWKRIADDLERATRNRRLVNLSRINRYAAANETLIVPGKVLASGDITFKINIA